MLNRFPILQALWADAFTRWAAGFLLALYVLIALAGWIAPYRETEGAPELAYAPPTPVFIVHEGRPAWPYVVAYQRKFDPETYGFYFEPDYKTRYPIRLGVQGEPYKLFGLVETRWHLFGVDPPAHLFLLGTDINGKDNFSRLLYGGQISLTIGFLGLLVAFPIGLLYGGVSGYAGGWVDTLMMRFAEIMMSIPSFYLLLSLAALLPSGMSSKARFALIVVILAFIGWAGLARVIRGMVLSIQSQEYVDAARVMGSPHLTIILRHILPQTASYFVVAATLGVPGYLLAESGLSFLGLGIQPPDASWGNMLREAQDLSNIMLRPWLLLGPSVLIFATILSFNSLGDKLRDVLDPKNRLRQH